MDDRRASSRLSTAIFEPVRSMILPSPEPSESDASELIRIPRGADPRDYDLSVQDDYEVWARMRPVTIKGRRTAAAEVAAEQEEITRSAWAFDEVLSDLTSSDEDDTEDGDSGPTRRPLRKERRARREPKERTSRAPPKWQDTYLPTPPASNDGDYDAPPPIKKLKVDLKEYLSAGLYSGGSVRALAALPLPINYGETLFDDERDFRLPFDILHDYRLNGEGRMRHVERIGRDMKPPHYIRIEKNYFPERHKLLADPKAICMCRQGDPCGEDCINRLMFYLCSPKLCPAGETCTNGPLNYRRPVSVRPFWTATRGFGLKTLTDIAAGDFIMEYCGEVISRDESYRRVLEDYEGKHDFYLLDYDGGEVLDAGLKGNHARFANHSCEPNVIVTRWKYADLDEFQIGLFARVDIPADTELTYDYGFLAFSSLAPPTPLKKKRGAGEPEGPSEREKARVRCMCGADKCIGWLGAKRKTREELTAETKMAARAAVKNSRRR